MLLYPADRTLTSGSVSGSTITIDVSLEQGFGGPKVDGSTLYGVTALSYGENGDADLYAQGDATHSFDYELGAAPPSVPQPAGPPGGKGKGGSGGSGSQPTPPPGQALPPETVPGASLDALRHLRFRSLRLAPVRFGAHSARLSGTGLLNERRVSFVAVAVDRGSRGDVFRIAWSHRAAIGGVLESGSVVVH